MAGQALPSKPAAVAAGDARERRRTTDVPDFDLPPVDVAPCPVPPPVAASLEPVGQAAALLAVGDAAVLTTPMENKTCPVSNSVP